jgi:UDP-2,3-diacylglucosamine pyrophosphatase LpxH
MMPRTNLSEDEFIATWMKFGGHVVNISKALGVNERSVHQRRKSIEDRRAIILPSNPTAQYQTRPREYVEKIGHRITLTAKDAVAVVFSDAHYWPGDKPAAHAALVRFIKAHKPQFVICGGDAFDGARISRHPPTGWAKMPDVADELAYCQQMMGEIEEAAPKGAKLCWTMGNHDSRFSSRLAQMAPDYVRVHGVDLPDHFPAWNHAWSVFINDVVIKHRFRNGVHATWNNTLHSGKTIVTGHLHRLAITPITDYNGRRYGVDCGTLSDFGPDQAKFTYGEDGPLCWASGFAVLMWRNGELLPPELAIVQNKVTWFRGEPL